MELLLKFYHMKKTILLFLLVLMGTIIQSCSVSHKTTEKTKLKLKVDSTATQVKEKQTAVHSEENSGSRVDSTKTQKRIVRNDSTRVVETFAPFVKPNGEVVALPKERITTKVSNQTMDINSVNVSFIQYLQRKLDSLAYVKDSLKMALNLSKSFESNRQQIDKSEPPNYWMWGIIIILLIVIGIRFFKF